jgi:malate/lactate dehydrogenase
MPISRSSKAMTQASMALEWWSRAQAVIRDERIAIPIGSYQARHGVTLSLPSVVGRRGVVAVLEPDLSDEERRALERSAETLKQVERERGLA